MNPPSHRVRRATLEDLPVLRQLWASMRLESTDLLEKQLTDFQVVVDAAEKPCGCVGFQIAGRHAHIHSEAYTDFGIAEQVRPMFWARFQALATNHGLARLWTREQSPFWTHNGFLPADAEALEKLPPQWKSDQPGWLMLKLRDEEALASLEKEFAMFAQSEKSRSEQALNQLGILKKIAIVIGFLFVGFLLVWTVIIYLNRARLGSTFH